MIRTFSKLRASQSYSLHEQVSSLGFKRNSRVYDPEKVHKLQKLINTYSVTPSLSLSSDVSKLASTDEEFRSFIDSFGSKKTELEPADPLSELHMHEQFRKKKLLGKFMGRHSEELKDEKKYKDLLNDPEKFNQPDLQLYNLFAQDQFHLMLLSAGSTTNVTKLARVNRRRCLVFMGNTDGIIGYGKGKGKTYAESFDNAVQQCKNNMIAIPIDNFNTNPCFLEGKHNNVTFQIFPANSGTSWGSPEIYNILVLSGMLHFKFKVIGRNRNPYSVIYAIFNALTQNRTLKMVAEETGRKLYDISWGMPISRYDHFVHQRPYS